VITLTKPARLVSQFTREGLTETSYWCGVLGIMANYDNPETKKTIYNGIMVNNDLLNWEERLLLMRLLSLK